MLENGFIKAHRSLLKWEWYSDINTCRLFVHLLLTVNYEPKKWQGILIDRGSRVSSVSKLASETGLSEQNVKTSIRKLKSTGELTSKSTNKHTLYTVLNYSIYQSENTQTNQQTNQQTNKQLTNNQQTTNKQLTTKKESNKAKKNTIYIYGECENVKLSLEEYEKLKARFTDHEERIDKLSLYIASVGNKYKSHYATILNWAKKDKPKGEVIVGENTNQPSKFMQNPKFLSKTTK